MQQEASSVDLPTVSGRTPRSLPAALVCSKASVFARSVPNHGVGAVPAYGSCLLILLPVQLLTHARNDGWTMTTQSPTPLSPKRNHAPATSGVAQPCTSSPNLVINPGFETGDATGWTSSRDISILRDNPQAGTGCNVGAWESKKGMGNACSCWKGSDGSLTQPLPSLP